MALRRGDQGRLSGLAAELVGLPVDLIATVSSEAALAAKQNTSPIPIVFCGPGDPVADGLVQSLAHPGGNLTGTTQLSTTLLPKKLSLLHELVPGLTRVAYIQGSLYSDILPRSSQTDALLAVARQLGLQINAIDVEADVDLEPAFEAARIWHAGAVLVGGATFMRTRHPKVMQLAAGERLPAMYSEIGQVKTGGLVSYGPSMYDLVRRAALDYVDRILRGANPAELPVEQPTTFELAVNQTTAQALGLTIPPAFAAQVTQWVP